MKHKNIFYTLLLMTGIAMSSCNDFLDKLLDNRTELIRSRRLQSYLSRLIPKEQPMPYSNFIATIQMIMEPEPPIIKLRKKIVITGKIPKKSIRIPQTICGKHIMQLSPPPIWF